MLKNNKKKKFEKILVLTIGEVNLIDTFVTFWYLILIYDVERLHKISNYSPII
jgi:hypothetical protein